MNVPELGDLADPFTIQDWCTRYAKFVDAKQWSEWRGSRTTRAEASEDQLDCPPCDGGNK
jgi:hypothetical protein